MKPSATFDKWDVIVVPYPFVEVFETKLRPALVLTQARFHNVHAVCFAAMITTARKMADVRTDDIEIDDVQGAGIRRPCVVRLSRISTIDLTADCRKIGELGAGQRPTVDKIVKAALGLN